MADIIDGIKKQWLKGMEVIGNAASSIAANTQHKVSEMNLVNRRREILADFGATAYALWQKGEAFPDELDALLKELSTLEETLLELRARQYKGNESMSPQPDDSTEESAAPCLFDYVPEPDSESETAMKEASEASALPEDAPKAEASEEASCEPSADSE